MIKDILVSLPVGRLSDSAVNYAVSVAAVSNAHLTGVAFVHEPFVPGTVFGGAATGFVATYRAEVEKAAKAAVISSRMRRDAPAFRPLRRSWSRHSPTSMTCSRRYPTLRPLSGRTDRAGKETFAVVLPETVLFGSGRPVLVVPYIQKAEMKLDRTLICWD